MPVAFDPTKVIVSTGSTVGPPGPPGSGGGSSPAGVANDVQITDGTGLAADSGNFTYDPTLHTLKAGSGNTATGSNAAAIGSTNTVSADDAIALGANAAATRKGQLSHASGFTNAQGLHGIDLFATFTAAAGNLVDTAGHELTFETSSFSLIRITIEASTAGLTKTAYEVHTIDINVSSVPALTFTDILDSTVSRQFSTQGWTLTFSSPSPGVFRINFDPGADTVNVLARVEWPQLYNL